MIVFMLFMTLMDTRLCETEQYSKFADTWTYATNGPTSWCVQAPACNGARQSPIDIVTSTLHNASYENIVSLTNYMNKPSVDKYNMTNNGHTLEIQLPRDTQYELTKGNDTYVPTNVHIHFDPYTGEGSEHTINSEKFFAEIQIVHRNKNDTGIYPIEEDPSYYAANGLLMIAIFVQLDDDTDTAKRSFYGYEDEYRSKMGDGDSLVMEVISTASKKLRKPGSKIQIDAFPLSWLLPKVKRNNAVFGYVNYHGSLTAPPCLEIVDWVIITGKTLLTNTETVKELFKVTDITGKQMFGNNRPIQAINERYVYGVMGDLV